MRFETGSRGSIVLALAAFATLCLYLSSPCLVAEHQHIDENETAPCLICVSVAAPAGPVVVPTLVRSDDTPQGPVFVDERARIIDNPSTNSAVRAPPAF